MSALESSETGNLESFQNPPDGAVAGPASSSTERQFPDIVDGSDVTHVVVRIATVERRVSRVARKTGITAQISRRERIIRVVDCVRPRVGTLDLQTMRKSMRDLRLEPVVIRVSCRPIECCPAEQCVVSNTSDKPESSTGDRPLACRISCALCHEIIHQGRIRRVRLEKTENVGALRANIASVQHPIASYFSL